MDLYKVTKASISTENASPAAFLQLTYVFFGRAFFFSHYYEQEQESLLLAW